MQTYEALWAPSTYLYAPSDVLGSPVLLYFKIPCQDPDIDVVKLYIFSCKDRAINPGVGYGPTIG